MHDLKTLAERYETREFLDGDPSWFMHQVEGDANKELLAFIASSLSYGSRKQFMPKIQYILNCSHGEVEHWLLSGRYKDDIPDNDECYYRLYSNRTMREFLDSLTDMLFRYGSLKNYVKEELAATSQPPSRQALDAIKAIVWWFRIKVKVNVKVNVIPQSTSSSCKRLCMFLRWMVREGSPVDLGLWTDVIDRRTLIMPLDTHVIQEASRLGLLESKTASMGSALKLTEKLRMTFPDDPLKGDFALFGLGVTS
jgi:uncharacterized protein (TIGR02757 family)